jgi:hypothetical protein
MCACQRNKKPTTVHAGYGPRGPTAGQRESHDCGHRSSAVSQTSCRTFRARKHWLNSEARRSPNLNVVAMTLAVRHRRKSDECLERLARAENQLQNHQYKHRLTPLAGTHAGVAESICSGQSSKAGAASGRLMNSHAKVVGRIMASPASTHVLYNSGH